MTILDFLKRVLRQKVRATMSFSKQSLFNIQYSVDFDILMWDSEWMMYQDFFISQLFQLLISFFSSHIHISTLKIEFDLKSILEYLLNHLREKIRRYTAFKFNDLFITRLKEWLCFIFKMKSSLLCLKSSLNIHWISFILKNNIKSDIDTDTSDDDEKYNIILFCHNMYDMKFKHRFIERTLKMLVKQLQDEMMMIFHRDKTLHLNNLIYHRTTSFSIKVVHMTNNNKILNCFASFITKFIMQNVNVNKIIQVEWRKMYHALNHHKKTHSDHLFFSSLNIMMIFTQHAIILLKLMMQMSLMKKYQTIKNQKTHLHRFVVIFKSTKIQHVQQYVQWVLKHEVNLIVINKSHSDHCLWSNVVLINMNIFDQVNILTMKKNEEDFDFNFDFLIIVEIDCKMRNIVRKIMTASMTVSLKTHSSVNAKL